MSAPGDLRELLEAYWEGSLDREGAERLARELGAGGAAASEALEEVGFAGLVHRAADPATGEELVRKFFQGMGIDVASGSNGAAAAPAPLVGTRRRSRLLFLAAAAAAAAAVLAAAWALWPHRPGRVRDAGSAGTVVDHRGDSPVRVAPVEPGAAAAKAGTILSGVVEVRSAGAGDFAVLPIGGGLVRGDAIRAASSGPAEIGLAGGVRLLLDAGAQALVVEDQALPCAITLDRGRIYADVEKGSPFSVLTSGGSVKSLGTKFAVSLSSAGAESGADGTAPAVPGEGLVVSVEEGSVEVATGGEVSLVESGCSLLVAPGCRARLERGEGLQRRLGWVEKWRGAHPGNGAGRGRGHGGGPRQGGAKGRGAHGNNGR